MLFTFVWNFQYKSIFCGLAPVAKFKAVHTMFNRASVQIQVGIT